MKAFMLALMLLLGLAALLGGAALAGTAASDTPAACPFAEGAFADGMANRVVRTLRTGFWDVEYPDGNDVVEVSVSLEHVLSPGWTCATWSAEILAPDDLSVVGASSQTGLARADEATFMVEVVDVHLESAGRRAIDMDRDEVREVLAVLSVAVQNGGDANVHVDGTGNDGMGRWHYPVEVFAYRP